MTVVPHMEGVEDFVAVHALWILRIARFVFFGLAGLMILRLWGGRVATGRKARRAAPKFFPAVVMAFAAMLAYQATWQLAGFTRPQFITFMRKHSHRSVNPASQHTRGSILDRNGVALALDAAGSGNRRSYPYGKAFAHLVGYADPMYGLSALEAADDLSLSGAGAEALKDWKTFGQGLIDHKSAAGNTCRLTVDARLQVRAMELLAGRPGAVVGLRPSDGAVLVLASSPSFDPNALDLARLKKQPETPMFNRALRGRYPPGSTFKVITACRAAEAGLNPGIACPGEGFVPPGHRQPIRDHEYYEAKRNGKDWAGHGTIDMAEGFSRSSNIYFSRLGIQLGAAALNDIAVRFALDRRIPVFEGSSGAMRSGLNSFPTLSPRAQGEIAQVAIGQGKLAVTPLHMALMTAAIANGGIMMKPHCAYDAQPEVLSQATTAAAARRVTKLMRGSVLHGTSRGAKIAGIDIAGKTGTAQNPSGEDHSWFVCFAPLERPQLALAVLVEGGGYGSKSALPVAVGLMRKAADLGLLEGAAPPGDGNHGR